MAENYAYSLSIGAEFDEKMMAKELQKIKTFLKNSNDQTSIKIKALIDQEGIEKQIYSTRNLLDKITGETKGQIEIFKFGDQFIEVQKNLDGVITSIEKMSQSMQRIQGDIQPIDNLDKRFENVLEKVHQLNNVQHRSFVNQEDLDALNRSAQRLKELQTVLQNLNAEKDYFSQQSDKVEKYRNEIEKLNTRMKDVESTSKMIKSAQDELDKLTKKSDKSDEDTQRIAEITKEIQTLEKQTEKSKSVIESLNKTLKDTKIPEFQGDAQEQIHNYEKLKNSLFDSKDAIKDVREQSREVTTEIKNLMNGMEVGINKANNSSKEYQTTFNELNTALKTQYKEATNVQKALNNAYSSGNESAIKRYSNQVKELNNEIKKTKTEMTKLTGNSSVQKNLSADYKKDYDNAKASEKYAKEEAAIKKLDVQLKELISTQVELTKAQSMGYSETYIEYLKQLESQIQKNVSSMTAGNKVLEKHAQEIKKAAQSTIESAEAQAKDAAERKKNSQILNQYKTVLQEYVKQKTKEYELEQRMKNNSSQRTSENQKLLNSYREEIDAIEQKLKLLKQEAQGTQTAAQMSDMYSESQRKLDQSMKEVDAEGKKQVNMFTNIAQGMKEAAARVVNYTLAFQTINAITDFLRDSVTVIKEMNDAMIGIQMVTGQTSKETAAYADELSRMAEGLGATTTEIAKASTEWLRQGKSIEDTNKLIEAGMVMSKVGAIESAEATEKLTSTLNGFKLGVEDAMHVVDAYSAVDIAAATSVDELAEAMSRTSNMASDMNISFEKMVG